jgi:hypothetical protein
MQKVLRRVAMMLEASRASVEVRVQVIAHTHHPCRQ